MTRRAKTLADALDETPAIAQLRSRLHASQSVARLLAAASPPIGGGFDPLRPGVCELRGRLLFLTATSSAQAAKLRQECPRLQKLLTQQGLDLNEIKVRIQPAHLPYRDEATHTTQVRSGAGSPRQLADLTKNMSAALRFADELALTLSESPVRQAIERLRTALRAGLTRSR